MCFAALAAGGLSGISSLVGIAGTAVSAIGQMQAAQASAAAAKFKAANDAQLAEDALKRGAVDEEAQRRKNAALLGRQRAVMAAGGVDLGQGSPLNVQADTAMLGELDAQTIKGNAQRESQAYLADQQVQTMTASADSTAGMIGAFGTILGGTKDLLASSWYKKPVGTGTYGATS